MARKKAAFSEEENAVLRDALRKFDAEQRALGKSQEAIGALLDMTQQNVSRLLAPNVKSPGGMGRSTANALAKALGYRDAEHLLFEASLESAAGRAGSDTKTTDREFAASVARRLGYEDAAIRAVLVRYDADSTRGRPLKWWLTKFGEEERELAADHLTQAPQTPPKSSPQRPRRR